MQTTPEEFKSLYGERVASGMKFTLDHPVFSQEVSKKPSKEFTISSIRVGSFGLIISYEDSGIQEVHESICKFKQ